MIRSTIATSVSGLALAVGGSWAPHAQELPQPAPSPAERTLADPLARRFDVTWSHRASVNRVRFDGRDQPTVDLSGSLWDAEGRRERHFVDRPADGGFERRYVRVGEVRRHTAYEFDRGQGVGEYFGLPIDVTSPMEGALVAWRVADPAGRLEPVLLERGDDRMLDELRPDGALAPWRVAPDVALGTTWTLAAEHLEEALAPGGVLQPEDPYTRERQNRDDDRALWAEALGSLEGELELELVSLREEASGRLAAVRVRGEPVARVTWGGETESGGRRDGELSARFELTGELLWDLGEDRFVRLDLKGDYELEVAITTEVVAARPLVGTITTLLSGSLSLLASAEPAEGAPVRRP
ncbi:MAG: hypothetical protein GC161_08825 [Planctomycetaceae bacterium]|nr:hypothetical protein [Planctomycetaceae bacterium]